MKKFITLILTLCIALGSAVCLSSCGKRLEYDDYEKYTPGTWAENLLISSIDIEWAGGKVEIASHEYGHYLSCSEAYEGEIPEDMEMRWYFDGQTLRIKPAADGVQYNRIPEKTLTVYIPFNYSFNDIDIKTESADISVSDSNANFAEINTVSGNIDVNFISSSQELDIESGSGSVNVKAHVKKSIEITTASGSVTVDNKAVPAETEITTASGDITYKLPEDAAFTAEIYTASGNITKDFYGEEKNGKFVVNDGTSEIEISSASGDIKLGFR